MSPGSCRLAQAGAADLLLPVRPACLPAAPSTCLSGTTLQLHDTTPGVLCIKSELPRCCGSVQGGDPEAAGGAQQR